MIGLMLPVLLTAAFQALGPNLSNFCERFPSASKERYDVDRASIDSDVSNERGAAAVTVRTRACRSGFEYCDPGLAGRCRFQHRTTQLPRPPPASDGVAGPLPLARGARRG